MAYKFSPSALGFYVDGLHSSIPNDAVDITNEVYSDILDQLTQGKVLSYNTKTGQPLTIDYVAPKVTWDQIRSTRDDMLLQCDWTQGLDAPITSEVQLEWRAYRQKLRDLTTNYSDPTQVVWPAEPPSAKQGE